MSELRLILGLARREVVERARTRSFQVTTATLLLGAVAAVALPAALSSGGDAYVVGLLAPADTDLRSALAAAAPEDTAVEFEVFDGRAAAEASLADGVDVLVIGRSELVWATAPDPDVEELVAAAITRVELADRAEALGLTADQAAALLRPVELTSTTRSGPDLASEQQHQTRRTVATVGSIVLLASIAFYGNTILVSVVEEKQNRVVEVLLAHVDPRDLLAGKLLAHGAIGLGQIGAIAAITAIGLAITEPVELPPDTTLAIASTVLWFVVGFAFYSIVYGAVGALASRSDEAQSTAGPLNFVLIGAFFAAMWAIDNPHHTLAVLGSMFPPTAPMVMPARSAVSDVAAWEIVLALVLELVAIVALVRLGGRLYRGSILRTGRRITLREAWHATT
jgi:ABC-2 type transport system permease protein